MNRAIANILGLVSICAVCLIGWAAQTVQRSIPDLSATISKVNSALDTVNHSCSPGPCGTLANVSKLTVKLGDIAVTTQKQVAQTSVLVTATANNLDTVGKSVKDVAGSLKGTADAATGTLSQAQTDLETANGPIERLGPLLSHSDAAVTDFDALLKNPAIPETLKNAQQITWNASEISFDAKRVADDATRKYFTPLPWYRKALPYATTGAKIAAYALPW